MGSSSSKVNSGRTYASQYDEACLARGTKAVLLGAGFGTFMGASMLAWYPDPYRYDVKNTRVPFSWDVKYVLRTMRGPVVLGSVVCGTYAMTECLVEQVRDPAKESTWVNTFWGGAASGLIMGSVTKRFDIMTVSALGTGIVMGLLEFSLQFGEEWFRPHSGLKNADWWRPSTPESASLKQLKDRYPEFKDL